MPYSYTIKEIASIVNGKLIGTGKNDPVSEIFTDSRNISYADAALFISIKGVRNDGHIYIKDVYDAGVRNFIVEKKGTAFKNLKDANFIYVNNSTDALQKLVAFHRKKFSYPVIGITGSNGKTMVKEWLYQLLYKSFHIVKNPKSYNSQTGVPLSVWQMNEHHDLGIFEAGISQPGEMKKLEKIIQPTIGVLTNIGQPHDEGFANRIEKIKEKSKLFKNCKQVVLCKDHFINFPSNKNIFTWSFKNEANLKIKKTFKEKSGTTIVYIYDKTLNKFFIPFTDDASKENAIICCAIMICLGYNPSEIKSRMKNLQPVAMRLQLNAGVNGCTIINDSYNSDLGSLKIAINLLSQQNQHQKKTIILSDILQSGINEKNLYSEVAKMLNKAKLHRVIGIGCAVSHQAKKFQSNSQFFESTEEFINNFNFLELNNEAILLKGARAFQFETIGKIIQLKAHETILEINLNALIHNLNYYKSLLKKKTKIMAMVKALSYGSGSYEIANILQFQKVDYLAVAYADEGVVLRKAGITLPIMVMNPEEQSFNTMLKFNLEPEIYSLRILNKFLAAITSEFEAKEKLPIPIHIKIDTGMKRLGFEENEIKDLANILQKNTYVKVVSVFSHLAASDEPKHDPFTLNQIKKFRSIFSFIEKSLGYEFLKHILNSSGVIRFPEAQMDMVRLGIGLYGIESADENHGMLQEVSSFKTTISQIKNINKGESIGYNRNQFADKQMQIATVGVGYADGFSRRLGNGKGTMFVDGHPAKIVGNVCMDMCMIDITGLEVYEGDEVVIFGKEYSVSEFAKATGTIPYEVLTSISQRVKRVYVHE